MNAADRKISGRRRRVPVVLVVEDDIALRNRVSDTLKRAGFVVLEATDGKQALQLLLADKTPQPMVIVLDVRVPSMSGPELLRILKSYHRLSRIPVILTSAGPRYVSDLSSGTYWLAKPFDTERLLDLVTECCRRPVPASPKAVR